MCGTRDRWLWIGRIFLLLTDFYLVYDIFNKLTFDGLIISQKVILVKDKAYPQNELCPYVKWK